MANKAAKALAAANTARLNQTLYLTLGIHLLFWLLRGLVFRASLRRVSLALYLVLASPQLLVQLYLERLGRPARGPDGTLVRAGADLAAPGLTESLWDLVYWTYGCVVLAALAGVWAWLLWAAVPLYALYAAWRLFATMRAGYSNATAEAPPSEAGTSKRQAKMDKRAAQNKIYR